MLRSLVGSEMCIRDRSKISQKQLKKHERHKLGKRKASEVVFWRFLMTFGVPREAQKCTKMEKMPSENQWKKMRQKRRRCRQSGARVGGHRAARRNARFLLRKVFALIFDRIYTRHHSRRSAADSFRSRDPRRPLRLKVSKLLFHIIDQHKNLSLIHI